MASEGKIETALLLDSKHWQERKQGGARPLRCLRRRELGDEGIYERVRIEHGLETRGEARDMIGKELRARLRESGCD